MMYPLKISPRLTNLFSSRFLTIGAGFTLTKADLFSIEAARGAAQMVLVSKPTIALQRQRRHAADDSSPEYIHAMSVVLPHCSLIRSTEHPFTRPAGRCWPDLWNGRRSDGLDHQAVLLGAS